MNPLIYTLLIGGVSGWLAGLIKKGYGFGIIGNIVVGIVGAFVGNWLFSQLNFTFGTGVIHTIATSVIGALVVLVVIGFIRKV